jgi:FMN phosphatase YigB (HAD superfamily)
VNTAPNLNQFTEYLIGAPNTEPAATPAPSASPKAGETRALPSVRTFDVFDTLIARRCIEPAKVFDIVAKRADLPAFAAARKQAEAKIAAHPYNLDMIYDELASALQLDPVQTAALKALEIDVELEQVIPIAENMALVRHGDVLISDMYLGHEIIRKLLDKAGLDKKVSLIVTSGGKRSGAIWPQAKANLSIEEHLGDNLHSDVEMPGRFDIAHRHTGTFGLNPVENVLTQIGLQQLAELCRETRLSTWSTNPDGRTVQVIQASLNFPIMLLGSVALARLATRLEKRSILFSSRDCDSWMPLFEKVAQRIGFTCKATYFYTSRLAKMQPSPSYKSYAKHLISEDALIVDLCGTGWSLANFAETIGRNNVPVFFLHKLPTAPAYEAMAATPQTCQFHTLIPEGQPALQNTMLEMCNYAAHGMVEDVRLIQDFAIPVFAGDNRSPETMAIVEAQQDCFGTAVRLMEKYDLHEVFALDDESLVAVTTALYQMLSQQMDLRSIYGSSHTAEESSVRSALGCA